MVRAPLTMIRGPSHRITEDASRLVACHVGLHPSPAVFMSEKATEVISCHGVPTRTKPNLNVIIDLSFLPPFMEFRTGEEHGTMD